MANPDLCIPCKQAGLSILVSLVLPVPNNTKLKLPAWVNLPTVTSVKMDGYTYALRAPRAGYIYVYYSAPPKGSKPWQVWDVGSKGEIYPLPTPSFVASLESTICRRTGHTAARLYTLVIENPLTSGPAWIAFSEHHWSEDTLKRYAADSELRGKRMQAFDPKTLAESRDIQQANIVAAKLEVVNAIADYDPAFDFKLLPYDSEAGTKVPVSRARTGNWKNDGAHDEAALNLHATRYPWSNARKGQAEQTLKMLKGCSKGTVDGHPGVVIALADPLGVVHELNGYCNDSNGRFHQYCQEWEKEIHAMHQIDGLKNILEQSAIAVAKNASEVGVFKWSPDFTAKRMASVTKTYAKDPARIAREQDLCRRWEQDAVQKAPSHVATQRGHYVTLNPDQWEKQNALVDKQVAQYTTKNARTGKSLVEQRQERGEAWGKAGAQEAAKDWPKYEAKINHAALTPFRAKVAAVEVAAHALMQKRVLDLIKWLEAPALVTALEDFHPANVADGVAFEEVVSLAIEGINATPEGRAKLDQWISAAKLMPGNIVQRALAFNQAEAIKELHAVMQEMAKKQGVVTLEPYFWEMPEKATPGFDSFDDEIISLRLLMSPQVG